jgi:hypothetical protein
LLFWSPHAGTMYALYGLSEDEVKVVEGKE